MKLYNVIVTVDVYVVAGDDESAIKNAQDAVMELLRADEIRPTYIAALPVANTPVQRRCQMDRPIVASDIGDDEFEQLKGKTVQDVHDMLTKKVKSS